MEATGVVICALGLYLAWLAGGRVRRGWLGLLPLTLPALLGALAAWAASTENRSECYEACGYEWLTVFALVSLGPALAIMAAFYLGRAWRASRSRRGDAVR